jgi:Mg2+ and Co2+ transporter CorA
MNVIVSTRTHTGWLVGLLALMVVMSAAVLVWARRKGWF